MAKFVFTNVRQTFERTITAPDKATAKKRYKGLYGAIPKGTRVAPLRQPGKTIYTTQGGRPVSRQQFLDNVNAAFPVEFKKALKGK